MKKIILGATLVFLVAVLGLALARIGTRAPAPTSPDSMAEARRITPAEVARHDRATDCWIIVRDRVYDVSSYIDQHPAPRETIVDTCGTDATRAFETKGVGRPHTDMAWRLLDRHAVGELARP